MALAQDTLEQLLETLRRFVAERLLPLEADEGQSAETESATAEAPSGGPSGQ